MNRRNRPDSPAEHAWREAMARAGYPVAPMAVPFHWSHLVDPRGDSGAAKAAYREWLAADPTNRDALEGLAFLLQHQGRYPEALPLRRRLAELRTVEMGIGPEDRSQTIEFLLAKDGGAEPPSQSPPAYVAALFDSYAETFDRHLETKLCYRGPQLVHAAVQRALRGKRDLDVLDAGCGTGLAGTLFREISRRLIGVDLSVGMLRKAEERGVYDQLHRLELTEFLRTHGDSFDLIVASDVLIYIGNLDGFFAAAFEALRPGGLLAFTVERGEGVPYRLQSTGRYVHSEPYLLEQIAAHAFEPVSLEAHDLRVEQNHFVPGQVAVLRRP